MSFCRIYVYFDRQVLDFWLNRMALLLNAMVINKKYVEKRGLSLDITSNDEYDSIKSKSFPDGFLYFTHSVEIEMDESVVDSDTAVNEINIILNELWNNGIAAVASCSFENLLFENGGYKSCNIPWV